MNNLVTKRDSRLKQLRKNKKGFTLVEVIVVLVILAILAAILIPALTGYIDKANEKRVIAEARAIYIAAQTTISDEYGSSTSFKENTTGLKLLDSDPLAKKIIDLSEVTFGDGVTATIKYDANGKVTYVEYISGKYKATFKDGTGWSINGKTSESTSESTSEGQT